MKILTKKYFSIPQAFADDVGFIELQNSGYKKNCLFHNNKTTGVSNLKCRGE